MDVLTSLIHMEAVRVQRDMFFCGLVIRLINVFYVSRESCNDSLLRSENEIRLQRVSEDIYVFFCAHCSTFVLLLKTSLHQCFF